MTPENTMTRGQQRFYTLHVWATAKLAYPDATVDVEEVPGTEHLPAKDRAYRFVIIRPSDGATLEALSTVAEVCAFCHEYGHAV